MKQKMTLEQADKIRLTWGKFLEVANGKLLMFFCASIPESFLPYPKEEIECALNITAEHFLNQGNKEAANTIQLTIPYLISFVDDKKAIDKMLKIFADPSYYDRILKGMQK